MNSISRKKNGLFRISYQTDVKREKLALEVFIIHVAPVQTLRQAWFPQRMPHFLKIWLLYAGSSVRLQAQLLKHIWGWTAFNVNWIQRL